jgi:3-deoxy-manno-octulosonate cytidylyltransferase (CMP-KDO synthetase)
VNAAIVIPARFHSTRFPGKPLALIAGRPLIEHVWRRAIASRRASSVWVATDHQEIFAAVKEFGGQAVMTDPALASGTDRMAAALRELEARSGQSFDQVVNVQGDEPLIDIAEVDALIEILQDDASIDIATLACRITGAGDFRNRDVVKVVTTLDGDALYFSRSPIPWEAESLALRHIGVYAFQTAALHRFTSLPPSPLEQAESLEQLRALQNGFRIRVLPASKPHAGVDRPEDVAKVEQELGPIHR